MILGLVALVTFLMKYNNDKNGDSVGMRNLSPMSLDGGNMGKLAMVRI